MISLRNGIGSRTASPLLVGIRKLNCRTSISIISSSKSSTRFIGDKYSVRTYRDRNCCSKNFSSSSSSSSSGSSTTSKSENIIKLSTSSETIAKRKVLNIDSKEKKEAIQRLRDWKKKQEQSMSPSRCTSGNSSSIAIDAAEAEASIAKKEGSHHLFFFRWGLPFVLFSVGAAYVVASGIDGRLKERAASFDIETRSQRQALMEKEHDDMMDKLTKITAVDFDNTKRIKRPEEILKERKLERERRNVWYRRWYRNFYGSGQEN